jgi:plasmid stabilization system protein ParE
VKVRFTDEATSRLRNIQSYIAEDSPQNSVAMIERIVARSESLNDLYLRGRRVPEYEDDAVREILAANAERVNRSGISRLPTECCTSASAGRSGKSKALNPAVELAQCFLLPEIVTSFCPVLTAPDPCVHRKNSSLSVRSGQGRSAPVTPSGSSGSAPPLPSGSCPETWVTLPV